MEYKFRLDSRIKCTKLIAPVPHHNLLERQRLSERLIGHLDRRLLLVSAPAGYGKTSLLVQVYGHLNERQRPCTWFSLEPSDNDYVRFLMGIVEALQAVGVTLRNEATAVLNAGSKASYEIVAASIFNAIASIERDIYLFIDDCHVIHSTKPLRFLRDILLAPSLGLHLIIGTRDAKNLPIARLRASRLLYEITTEDLKFSNDEALKYFGLSGREFQPNHVELLHKQTEGWIAGLQLASLAVFAGEDPAELVVTLSGERKEIAEFLLEEVLRRQPATLQRFLLESSILSRFDAVLCNEVMSRRDSAQIIARVRDSNLFLVGLDKEDRWFRFHHLFSQAMRRRLYNEDPTRYAELNLLASESLAKRGYMLDAIEHAFSAGSLERAGELLDSIAYDLFARGETATLRTLAKRLPRSTLRSLPRLQLELAWDAEIGWEFSAASEALLNVRSWLNENQLKPRQNSAQELAWNRLLSQLVHREMMLAEFRDDLVSTRNLADQWIKDHQVNDPFMRASVGTTLILCNRELGYCDLTIQTARDLHVVFERGNAVYGTVFHGAVAGSTFFSKGELKHAETVLSEALDTASRIHGAGSPLAAMPALLLADVLYEQNRLNEVRDVLEIYGGGTPELGFADNVIASFLVQARIAKHDGDATLATDILRTGRAMAKRLSFIRMEAAIAYEQMLLEKFFKLESGDEPYAVELDLIKSAINGENSISFALDLASMLAARERGNDANGLAVEVMQKIYKVSTKRNNIRVATRAAVQLALIAQSNDWQGRGSFYTTVSLLLSRQHGFVRTILDAGAPFMALLNRAVHDSGSIDTSSRRYADELLSIGMPTSSISLVQKSKTMEMQEQLLTREVEILRMALESRTNAEIAHNLHLSENTVKWYWQRIFDKLDVRRRQDAIQRARNMNLL